jgi:hypothetical protein
MSIGEHALVSPDFLAELAHRARCVWKHLEEAVEYDVLNLVPMAHHMEPQGAHSAARASSLTRRPDSFKSGD